MANSIEHLDKRIKRLIKSCIRKNHRSLFAILGQNSSKQIPVFYHLLKQRKIKDVSTLWCSKGGNDALQESNKSMEMTSDGDIFQPIYCSYCDVDQIVYQNHHLAILEDFEVLTLKILASILETVKGGGIIVCLFHHAKTVDDLTTLNLDAEHKLSRFSRRFAFSLASCSDSMILDDNLIVLLSSTRISEKPELENYGMNRDKIVQLKQNHENDTVISSLIDVCQTCEQAELLLKFLDILKKRTLHTVVSVSSPVGRGKSAALGLAVAGGLALNYSNIFISSMDPHNVKSVFKFILRGLDALGYKEDKDFDLIESLNPKFENALIGINVFRDHPQSVRFILPGDVGQKFEQAELVVLDEATSIPFNLVKQLIGPYVVLMASSISGPGSTSPYLYNNMINAVQPSSSLPSEGERFLKCTLNEPVNYASGDGIEAWMNHLLCSKSDTDPQLSCGFPLPAQCELFCISHDTLFGGSSLAESCLESIMLILSSSNRVMDPDYLFKLADSSNFRIFCLLPPIDNSRKIFPGLICVILVHLENEIPDNIIHCGTNLKDPVSNCFNKWKTETMTSQPTYMPIQGIHILNIVTHHSYRKMGYGSRALQLLQSFYEGKCISLYEDMQANLNIYDNASMEQKNLDTTMETPIFQQLTEIEPESIEYILVSCNLISESLRFWKKVGFLPVYISEKMNREGEHILFMTKGIAEKFEQKSISDLSNFQSHYSMFLGSAYQRFPASLALSLLHFNTAVTKKELTKADIDILISPHRMKSLQKYCQNLRDFHTIMQFIPTLSSLYFKNYFKDLALSRVQEAILLSFGLQFKTADDISKDLGLPNMQIFGLLNRAIKKVVKYLTDIIEKSVAKTMEHREVVMEPIAQDLDDELEEAAKKIQQQQENEAKKLQDIDISEYTIRGSEDDWEKALFSGRKTLVSIKSIKKTNDSVETVNQKSQNKSQKYKKQKHRR